MSDLQPSTLPTPKRARRAQPWANRIVGYGEEAPDQLLANPKKLENSPEAATGCAFGSAPVILERLAGMGLAPRLTNG